MALLDFDAKSVPPITPVDVPQGVRFPWENQETVSEDLSGNPAPSVATWEIPVLPTVVTTPEHTPEPEPTPEPSPAQEVRFEIENMIPLIKAENPELTRGRGRPRKVGKEHHPLVDIAMRHRNLKRHAWKEAVREHEETAAKVSNAREEYRRASAMFNNPLGYAETLMKIANDNQRGEV